MPTKSADANPTDSFRSFPWHAAEPGADHLAWDPRRCYPDGTREVAVSSNQGETSSHFERGLFGQQNMLEGSGTFTRA